jgi:uncharacterized protein with HEPN domain
VQPRDWVFRINDILEAIAAVETYVTGITYEEFAADRKTVDAVIRNLIIIGEAAAHIPEEIWSKRQDFMGYPTERPAAACTGT